MTKKKSKKSELDEKKSQHQHEEPLNLQISDEVLDEIIGHQRLLREPLAEFEKADKSNVSEDEED
ncbi:MAG: hypothetical protein ACFFC7_19470 [Candidatus Hermodarchaeota archaeon]